MSKLILFHGTPNKVVIPTFGLGDDKHDYGKGFYLTENLDLAKEWVSEKYGADTSGYDVIKGWRADASYFYIAKEFVKDNVDVEILEELLLLGDLGIQYCIKSELAYSKLREVESGLIEVKYDEFNKKYNARDVAAREKMRDLVNSDANKVIKVFSTLFER